MADYIPEQLRWRAEQLKEASRINRVDREVGSDIADAQVEHAELCEAHAAALEELAKTKQIARSVAYEADAHSKEADRLASENAALREQVKAAREAQDADREYRRDALLRANEIARTKEYQAAFLFLHIAFGSVKPNQQEVDAALAKLEEK